jgi:sugar lactone lactonase YvrE
MWHASKVKCLIGVIIVAAIVAAAEDRSIAQGAGDPNVAPNPYRVDEGWAKLAQGRKWGAAVGVDIDRDGKGIWVFDRCATADDCSASSLAPIQKFDASGRLVTSFGAGMFNYPHGLFVDRDGNVWVSDGRAKNGKGHTVMKFTPDGKLLMTLGKPGVAGDGPDTFNAPSDILIAPNGDIFIADGHGGETNARIVKLSKDGKFIKAWGKKGSGPGEFDAPHGLAMDSTGRLFVADRSNSRIQVFNQDGRFLAEWRQFGRPSGVFIDKKDVIYVADSTSTDQVNAGFKQGIRIGSVKDGKVTAFIPWTETNTLEGVAADDQGNVYGGFTNTLNFRRFVKNTTSGQSPATSNALVGAWRVTEIADANATPITNPQPGLYIFTRQHYSFTRINGTRPLPEYPSNDKATDADKVAVFNMLYLNTGTYTVSGNMLATRAAVAKSAFAIGGAGNQYEFAVTGNTLVLTQRPSGAVIKLSRLE